MMFVSIGTKPGGSAPNEDWTIGSPEFAIVLDGISTAGLDTGCQHGVPWFVANLGAQLAAALTASNQSLSDALSVAIEIVANLHPGCDLKYPGTPSATVSILRERQDRLDYLVLSDSPIVLEGQGGFTVVNDLRVEDVLPEFVAETERHEIGSSKHRDAVSRLVSAQRSIRNTPAGYWVASAMPEAANHAITGSKARSDVRSAALMSDGVSRLVTDYGAATWLDVFRTLQVGGPRELISNIRKIEATDPHGKRWPRYKSGDDATVAYCYF